MATLEDDRQAVAGLVPVATSGRSGDVSAFAHMPPSGRLGRRGYSSSLSAAFLGRAILCAMAMLICVGACSVAPAAVPVPELPYTFGPSGHGEGPCSRPDPARPPADSLPSGCVVRYVFKPGSLEVDLEVFNLPGAGTVVATACIVPAQCPAAGFAPKSEKRSTGSGSDLYTAHIPLRPGEVKGVSRICGVVSTEAIGSFRPPTSGTPLSCLNLSEPLSEAAGALRITPGRQGLELEGWVIDPQTDTSGTVDIRKGVGEARSSANAIADDADMRSTTSWPGFSGNHGFTATLPYTGRPGTTTICVRPADHPPAAGDDSPCFDYDEPSVAFGPDGPQTQGALINVSLRNVGPATDVKLNFRSDAGYFLVPWTDPSVWHTLASASGSAEFSIDSSHFPPGRYAIAFHCLPECPGRDLDAAQLVGGRFWRGNITFASLLTILPSTRSTISVASDTDDTLRVSGADFPAGQRLRLVVVPNLRLFDGPPLEAAPVEYPVVDKNGTFSAQVGVAGLPLRGVQTQVIVFADNGVPLASTLFTTE
jgi:hypothetical protein